MNASIRTRVAVNGYGVIGKRVADAVARQDDMELAGVSDISADWRARMVTQRGYRLYCAASAHARTMRDAGPDAAGALDDLLKARAVVVHWTPTRRASKNRDQPQH